jgi:S1-C subfamily serine protease
VGRRARPAVVVLQPVDGATSGTAWFIDKGHLVTNAHVLDELPGDAIEARFIDGRTVDVAVARRRATPDLALLSAELEPPATLQPGDSTSLTAGQPLVQIGHVRLGY